MNKEDFKAGDQYRIVRMPGEYEGSWGDGNHNGDIITLKDPPVENADMFIVVSKEHPYNIFNFHVRYEGGYIYPQWIEKISVSPGNICNCDINILMSQGCQCGSIAKNK